MKYTLKEDSFMKKIEMVKGGLELLATIGVGTLVGGALVLVKPAKMGVIKKMAVSVAGLAITGMATDGVTKYIGKQFDEIATAIKEVMGKKSKEEEIEKVEEVQA